MEKTKERKAANRKSTVAIGICLVLVLSAFSGLVLFHYNPMLENLNSEASSKQSQINALNAQVENLTNQVSTLLYRVNGLSIGSGVTQSQYNSLSANYTQLNDKYNQLLENTPKSVISIQSVSYNSTLAGVTQVIVRNSGASDVQVVALNLYLGSVLSSSLAEQVAVSANSTATFDKVLPFVGPGVYMVSVETDEGFSATSTPFQVTG